MEATELMIGDWVMYRGEPIIVYEIDEYYNRINTEPDGYDSIKCIELSELQPIPLTAEILEKNGFKIKEKWAQIGNFGNSPLIMWHFADDHILRHYKAELEVHQNDTGKVHVHIPCEYVHQLQHALRLCGIDKEIKL